MIRKAEMKEYRYVLKKYGYNKNDFDIDHKNESENPTNKYLSSIITIENVKTGINVSYNYGHGYAWVPVFAEDLKNGAFGVHNPT